VLISPATWGKECPPSLQDARTFKNEEKVIFRIIIIILGQLVVLCCSIASWAWLRMPPPELAVDSSFALFLDLSKLLFRGRFAERSDLLTQLG
jgi:hypothetical protein